MRIALVATSVLPAASKGRKQAGRRLGKPAIAGGTPAFDRWLVFGRPVLGDEEIEAVADVIRSGWIGTGERAREFEQAFAEKIGAAHAISVSSCTAALHVSLEALGIGPGDEVITTAMTFVATVNAIMHAGATPVLVDVDPLTLNLDLDDVRRRIGPRTRALLPVHFGGLPVDLTELRALAGEHGLVVLEDAAHALGARFAGAPIGAGGTAVCFSFYPNKAITTGEGGMVTTDDAKLAELLRLLRHHGLLRDAWERFGSEGNVFNEAIAFGFKYNLTDLQAALGLVQLGRLDDFIERRRTLGEVYGRELARVSGLRPQPRPWNDDVRHGQHLYIIEVDEQAVGLDRDALLGALSAENIGTGVHYRAIHLHPYYRTRLGLDPGALPVAERLSTTLLSLPLSAAMSEDDVVAVVDALERIQAYALGNGRARMRRRPN
jgi:dTDP-4-amino-4,6-dideoxygalactose transaminase